MPLDNKRRLLDALRTARWIITDAARALGVSRQAIYLALTRYQIRRLPPDAETLRGRSGPPRVNRESSRLGGIARISSLSAEERTELARLGAQTLNNSLTAEQRRESARAAARARWAREKKRTRSSAAA